ncbi:MAG TPA: hypothetical protein VG056_12470 [Pirellulales bacterium]|nr:hypothetical protein [Pirellulales bacterium]
MKQWLLSAWLWLAVYLVAIGGIAIYIVRLRDHMLDDRPEITANERSWQDWVKSEVNRDSVSGPIQRAPPKSPEPPMLVLMRDHFGVIFCASVIFPAIIIGFMLIVTRGMLSQSVQHNQIQSAANGDSDVP